VPTDFLTGSTSIGRKSLVAIKIDNAPLARRFHQGLGRAAIVYQEIVEGGLTRFLAIYESDLAGAGEVGPIRSARGSDIEILRAFGKIPLGFSGGQPGVLSIFSRAAKRGWLIDASYDEIPSAYRLGAQRADARNFFAVPSTLASRRPGNGPRDIGLRFGTPLGGEAASRATVAFSGQTRVGMVYNAAKGTYAISQNGVPTRGAAPATVIVQRVVIKGSGFKDVNGFTTPRTITTGSGRVTVLRKGGSITGTWKRKGFGPTRFLDRRGRDIVLPAGPIWVLLMPTTGSISFR